MCQKSTGSCFSYTGFFATDAVEFNGELRTYRSFGDAGRYLDYSFCIHCGVTIGKKLEVFPELVGVPAGCFADPSFGKPMGFYHTVSRHEWLGGGWEGVPEYRGQ